MSLEWYLKYRRLVSGGFLGFGYTLEDESASHFWGSWPWCYMEVGINPFALVKGEGVALTLVMVGGFGVRDLDSFGFTYGEVQFDGQADFASVMVSLYVVG